MFAQRCSFPSVLRVCLLSVLFFHVVSPAAAQQQFPPAEQLGRGLVALPASSGGGQFVSWRLLGTDDAATTFDLLRDGTVIASDLKDVTSFTDAAGTSSSQYQVLAKVGGQVVGKSLSVTPWTSIYRTLKLDRPGSIYTPNDCSVGDVDGDGEYELFVKWDPSTSKDNSQGGKTDNVYIDCYKIFGEGADGRQALTCQLLWRIDLGCNIRAGAHYTQFLVYDFDGDGRAELICKTAPGSRDGQSRYVSAAATENAIRNATDNATDYRNSSGYVLNGPEYLTVFNGLTGAAIHTIYYRPNRAGETGGAPSGSSKSFWGDDYGNRCDRYLACVAYLDGSTRRPAAVMGRGYYTKAYLWAVDFDGQQLSTKWLHSSLSSTRVDVTDANGNTKTYTHNGATSGSGSNTLYGNGNHNLSVADVDGDGRDEIIYGSAAVDHNGQLLYATGFGHGDAIHLSDLIPDRPGLEVFQVHEEKGTYSWDLHDAATGEVIHKGGNSGVDNGRGMAADLLADNRGFEFCSSDDRSLRSATSGNYVSSVNTSVNFRIYWDGDLQDELLDDKILRKVVGSNFDRLLTLYNYGGSTDCNSTKHSPCLMADLFGDWREEIIYYDYSDGCTLNIFTTNLPTAYRVPTLMHDHVYRLGVAWQNVSYNQPPHLGYYLPDLFAEGDETDEAESRTVVYRQDYEQESDASTWQSPNAYDHLTLNTDETQYIQYTGNGSTNSRSNFTFFSSNGLDKYRLEFDFALTAGTKDASELAVMAEGGSRENNKYYHETNSEQHYLLDLTSTGAYSNTYVINGNSSHTVDLPSGIWCHAVLDVDAQRRTVTYTISQRAWGTVYVSGTYALPAATSHVAAGLYYLSGRYSATGKFDNIVISVDAEPKAEVLIMQQDYEQENDARTWQSPNAYDHLALKTDDTQYIQYTGDYSTNSRSNFTLFDVEELARRNRYTLEFDFALTAGNKDASELAVMAVGGVRVDNKYYHERNSELHYLLDLTSTGANSNTYVINGNSSHTVDLPSGVWCHARLDVDADARSVAYVISRRDTRAKLVKDVYWLPEATSHVASGLYYLSGRYNATGKFDNIVLARTVDMGDVNDDGRLTIADVTALVNILLGTDVNPASHVRKVADMDSDGLHTVDDVRLLVGKLLSF